MKRSFVKKAVSVLLCVAMIGSLAGCAAPSLSETSTAGSEAGSTASTAAKRPASPSPKVPSR